MSYNRVIETLLERRSIRSYRPEQISEDELADILHAAKYAPTARGLQARHFTVIQNKQFLAEIAAAATGNENDSPFYHAPTVIVLSAPQEAKYGREDCACAIMNIMLAAEALGIGTCYICSALDALRSDKILRRLKLPEGYVPYGSVAVGYAKEHAEAPKERCTNAISYIQ
ncbi:MAG: hypothetical protein GX485_02180 [Clostridiales bacterium]|nr:hypothetical protein [Clostridiales bacterium]